MLVCSSVDRKMGIKPTQEYGNKIFFICLVFLQESLAGKYLIVELYCFW